MNDDRPSCRPADRADGVVEQPAARAQRAAQDLEVAVEVLPCPTCSDMPIDETASNCSPPSRGSPAGGSRPGRRRPASATRSAGQVGLGLADRDADDGDVVVGGGVDRHRAPAAPDVEQARAGAARRARACGRSGRAWRLRRGEVGVRRRRSGRTSTSSTARARAGRSRCRRRSGGRSRRRRAAREWRPPCRRASSGGGGSGRPSTRSRRAAAHDLAGRPQPGRGPTSSAGAQRGRRPRRCRRRRRARRRRRPGPGRAGSGSTAAGGRRRADAAATSRRPSAGPIALPSQNSMRTGRSSPSSASTTGRRWSAAVGVVSCDWRARACRSARSPTGPPFRQLCRRPPSMSKTFDRGSTTMRIVRAILIRQGMEVRRDGLGHGTPSVSKRRRSAAG